MKRMYLGCIVILFLCTLVIPMVCAQENVSDAEPGLSPSDADQLDTAGTETTESQNETLTEADLFIWAGEDPVNWGKGILFAFLGFIGALVAIFTLIGGAIPGTAGAAAIEADTIRLKAETDRLDTLIHSESCNPECITAVASAVDKFRDDLNSERWRQFTLAGVIYLILGAFFASMLALNMLQALLVGFGWTGVIGSLGLKSDYQYRKSAKDDEIEQKTQDLEDCRKGRPVEAEPKPPVAGEAARGPGRSGKPEMMEINSYIARKL